MKFRWMHTIAAAMLLSLTTGAAQAQGDFYEGKTIEIVVPASSGGSYGIYAQLLAEVFSKYIPGNPQIVPEYMSGAGGLRASNHVANAADTDGTAIYMMNQNAPNKQLLSPEQVRYDAGEFIPIGTLSSINSAMVVRKDAAATNLAGFKENEVIVGVTGRGSYQFVIPTLLNEFQNTKFKIITAYPGTGETMLAVDRNEVQAMLSSLLTFQERRPGWVDGSGDAMLIFQIGETADPSIPDVPRLSDLAESDDELALYKFMSSGNSIGRSLVFPAGVPQEQVDTIRQAFQDMLADPEFQALCKERDIKLASATWQELEATIDAVLATPPTVYEKAQAYMSE